jgi:hypothetical protein
MRFSTDGSWYFYNTNTSGARVTNMELYPSNYVYFNNYAQGGNSLRAPIFYDSNNTGYYLDPNATSNLWEVYSYSYRGNGNVGGTGNASWHPNGIYSAGFNWLYGGINGGGSNATNFSDVRANIFYDYQDTGYYADPNGTSNFYNLNLIGGKHTYLTINPGNGWEAMVRYIGGSGSSWYVGKRTSTQLLGSTDAFHMYSETAGRTVGGYDTAGNHYAYGSSRATIFYDIDDTTYYMNPNSNTYLYGTFQVNGGHGDSQIGVRLLSGNNGAGAGEINLRMWVSEPGVTWNWGGFGYNVTNNNGSPNGFGRINTAHGQAYMRFSDGGDLYFYNTNTSGTRVTNMEMYPNNTVLFNNYATGGNSLRAPIFYDSDNTGYYGDFASTSRINAINYDNLYWAGDTSYGFIGRNVYADTVNGRGSDPLELNYYDGGDVYIGPGGGNKNLRANLYYDYANTAYYLDPNGTARLSYVVANGGIRIDGNENLYLDNNYGQSIVGVYTSVRYQGIFAMGNAYKLAIDGTGTGNLYGLSWSHPNAGGQAGFLNDHGLLVMNYGTTFAAISSRGWFRTSVQAPIFYDNDDTGYYGNYAGDRSTSVNGFTARTVEGTKGTWKYNIPRFIHTGDSNYWVGSMGWGTTDFNTMMTWGSGFIDSWSNPSNQPSGTSHWVGTQAYHYTNAYNSAYGWQLVGGPIGNLRFRQSWPNAGTWRTVPMLDVNDGNSGAMYAGIYYDSADSAYYADPASTSRLNITKTALKAHNDMSGYGEGNWVSDFNRTPISSFTFGEDKYNGGPSGTWWFQVNMRHANSSNYWGTQLAYGWEDNANEIYQRNITGGSFSGWVRYLNSNNYSGYSNFGTGTVYGGIYYDGNNSGYYGDFASTSRFNTTITDTTYFGSDTNKGRAQGYGTWSNSFHKTAYMSFDWNANYDTYSNHGIASTDLNGSFSDSMSINSFNDINLRLDSNDNNANSYVRIHDNTTGQSVSVAYIGRESGNPIAYFNNRVYGNVYYHNSDTAYYLAPNGTSRLNRTNYDYVYSYNWVYAQGDVIAYYSDERLKTKVGSIENALDKISKLNGFYYVENDLAKSFGYKNEKRQLGLSAQEVQEVLPEIVTLAPFDTETDKNNNIVGSKSGEDYLTVNYAKVVPLLVEGIKEQTEIINSQQKQIDELKEMIKSLIK